MRIGSDFPNGMALCALGVHFVVADRVYRKQLRLFTAA